MAQARTSKTKETATSKPAARTRRTQAQQEECIDFAHNLLTLGIPPFVVAQRLQRKFSLSRSSAWRDVAHANDRRGSEGIKRQPGVLELRDSLVNLIFCSAVEAADESDFGSLAKLSREVRELAKLGGFEQRSSLRGDPAVEACRNALGDAERNER